MDSPYSRLLEVSLCSSIKRLTGTNSSLHRLFYKTDDLENYFANLETAGQLPDLDTILDDATTLADRYTSQAAIQNSMRTAEATSPKNPNPVPMGTPWSARGSSDSAADINTADTYSTNIAQREPRIHRRSRSEEQRNIPA
jgi:hypothetical protein